MHDFFLAGRFFLLAQKMIEKTKLDNDSCITINKLTKLFSYISDKSVDLTVYRTENQLNLLNELKDSM